MPKNKLPKEVLDETPKSEKPEESLEDLIVKQETKQELESSKEMFTEKELREKIEGMTLDPNLTYQSKAVAKTIKPLKSSQKLEKLFSIAKKKGVIYAIHVAKKIDDPYILDAFHDLLAKEGYYKNFTK